VHDIVHIVHHEQMRKCDILVECRLALKVLFKNNNNPDEMSGKRQLAVRIRKVEIREGRCGFIALCRDPGAS
jgi:hypothetical protein